ncbi:threonylcarbamoyl-AMP synthase, putative [Plasmodium gallinaceum]|uniref:Threonylcarbamoyl-AMP synthase n=1 Tax=Plasmodium gallinaceum TaxID=5849 RepID=A0A1J1GUJ1_PLAGA|nr:threonylcarbamoyl-AMP synthase, putative [Plasmodium gallinaceum]CRG95969.1 threonylcarbamoyl-AMP synthase, putative [Plasmodium gallinaceum]
MAKIIEGLDLLNNDDIKKKLKQHIDKNHLIGFPTETVYGLGGNSLNEDSLKNIFKMKNRPVSDPIISHVCDISQAFEQLYHVNIFEKYIIYILNKKFWPGPLSIIAKAKKNVPLILTAHTKFCAVRLPNNLIAREIIKICETPIAAPSANKFQHISPTTSLHVFEEFKNENILIFDDGQCDVGIESTVIKITKFKKKKNVNSEKIHKNIDNEINDIQEKNILCNTISDDLNFKKNDEHDHNYSEDEITTDDEYDNEYKEELKVLCQLTNSNNSDSNKEMYMKLKSIFENIESDKKIPDYILQQILKYKRLYNYKIIIYRRGKYTKNDIEEVLKSNKLLENIEVDLYKKIKFEDLDIFQKESKSQNNPNFKIIDKNNDIKNENTNNQRHTNFLQKTEDTNLEKNEVSPGLLITHYSPFVSTYLIDIILKIENYNVNNNLSNIQLNKCIFLDIGNSFIDYQNNFLKYINIYYDNLPKEEQIKYVTKNFFLFLRKAETLAINNKAENILISVVNLKLCDEIYLSIFDRIFRSASGKILKAYINNDKFQIFNN